MVSVPPAATVVVPVPPMDPSIQVAFPPDAILNASAPPMLPPMVAVPPDAIVTAPPEGPTMLAHNPPPGQTDSCVKVSALSNVSVFDNTLNDGNESVPAISTAAFVTNAPALVVEAPARVAVVGRRNPPGELDPM